MKANCKAKLGNHSNICMKTITRYEVELAQATEHYNQQKMRGSRVRKYVTYLRHTGHMTSPFAEQSSAADNSLSLKWEISSYWAKPACSGRGKNMNTPAAPEISQISTIMLMTKQCIMVQFSVLACTNAITKEGEGMKPLLCVLAQFKVCLDIVR